MLNTNLAGFSDDVIPIHDSMPLLGSQLMATVMAEKGHIVTIKDWFLEKIDFQGVDFVGISTTALDLKDLKEIASVISKSTQCKLIAGGPLFWSYAPEKVLKEIPQIDFVVLGEGEQTFVELISVLIEDKDVAGVKGIAYNKDGRIVITEKRNRLCPESIPAPDWRLLDFKNRLPLLPIETARGCTYNCAFCSEVHYWGKPVRFRNVDHIVDEIKNNYEQLGICTYRISDSCFSAPESRSMQVCDALLEGCIRQGIPLKWSAFARVNNLNGELLEKMKLAGCVALDIGMESGDSAILKGMNKGYSYDDIIEGVRIAKKVGIFTHCNVIIGFPGETPQSIVNTISVLNDAQPDSYHCMLLDMAPNTILSDSPEKFNIQGDRLVWQHDTMSYDQALGYMKDMIARVKFSCLFPGGELSAIMLASIGFDTNRIKRFFRNITRNKIGEQETEMFNQIWRR